MKLAKFSITALLIFFTLGTYNIYAQNQTVGMFVNEEDSFNGYTLFTPMRSSTIYLIDNQGRKINSWDTNSEKTIGAYLSENGDLVVSKTPNGASIINGPIATGIVEKYDWNGNLLWTFELNNAEARLHHDFEVLPNGNVLMVAWEIKTTAEAIAQGRDPSCQ
ncbi:MAG: aryl-sulfate sulfotransferase [Bacteroidales bacterium]